MNIDSNTDAFIGSESFVPCQINGCDWFPGFGRFRKGAAMDSEPDLQLHLQRQAVEMASTGRGFAQASLWAGPNPRPFFIASIQLIANILVQLSVCVKGELVCWLGEW